MATPIFYLHIQSQDCTAEIRLNDAPMFAVVREHAQVAFPTISEWVIAGENLLGVHLHAIADAPRIRVALCQAELGDVPEPGQAIELIVIEWPPIPLPTLVDELADAAPIVPELPGLPLELSEVGVADQPWGVWSWEQGPPFPLDARTTQAVLDYVRDLHATLAAGSVDTLIAESSIKFDEVAPAYAMSADEARERIHQAWQGLTSHGDFVLAPFDETDLDLRLHCGGRVVEPTTLEGLPILRQAVPIDDESWSLPIFIGRTNWEYAARRLAILR